MPLPLAASVPGAEAHGGLTFAGVRAGVEPVSGLLKGGLLKLARIYTLGRNG